MLDRTTALIAAIFLATLPSAIYHSRLGVESSQLPVFGLVIIACAIRGHGLGLLLSFLASMLVNSTAIFLMPIVLPIFLVQLLGMRGSEAGGDPVQRQRVVIVSVVVALVVALAVSLVIFNHPKAEEILDRRPVLNWGNFLDGYERLLFFLYGPPSTRTLRLHRWIFRAVLFGLLMLGTGRLVRHAGGKRPVLIAGLGASLAVFHFVAGPGMLRVQGTHRYGVVFLLPTSLAFACLLQSLVPTRMLAPSLHPAPAPLSAVDHRRPGHGLRVPPEHQAGPLRPQHGQVEGVALDVPARRERRIPKGPLAVPARQESNPSSRRGSDTDRRASTTGSACHWPISAAPARISMSSS